jgi:hypothetical protein
LIMFLSFVITSLPLAFVDVSYIGICLVF